MVDLAMGPDRVAANGDVCNKIGTYLKALAARDGFKADLATLEGVSEAVAQRDFVSLDQVSFSDEACMF